MEESEVKLLNLSRNGRHLEILELLDAHPNIDINCKGKSKSTYSWTALHLASYFGHTEAVKVLLSRGANPNIRNHTGDTALHKASLTKREEVVHCLLEHSSNPTIANDDRKTPSQVASDIAIKNVLEAAEKVHLLKETEKFLQFVKEGQEAKVEEMISRYGSFVNMDTPDEHGNTALHHAAMRDQRTIAIVLLQHGVDPSKRNKQGERACDVTMSSQMKKILDVKPVRQNHNMVQRFEGPLMKKKRFLSPRWHWVVLERGVISYFARRADAAVGSKRRFFKYLTESTVTTREDNNHGFVVRFFDGSFHHLMVNQSNKPLINRQKWVDAIREHAEYSNHFVAADNVVDSDSESDDPIIPIIDIKNIVQTAEVHQKVLQTHVEHLTPLIQKFIADETTGNKDRQLMSTHVLGKCHEILGSATDMMKEFQMCLNVMQRQEQIRESKLLDECERNRVLQQSLQALATQHHNLELTIESQAGSARESPSKMPCTPEETLNEATCSRHCSNNSKTSSGGFLSDEDEFYDAISGDSDDEDDVMNFEDVSLVEADEEPKYHAVTRGDYDPTINSDESQSKSETSSLAPVGGHRDRLACPMFSRDEFSIWHILRQCIGKELSKITMPVIFNEPLSFIQRLCEYMEYSCLLERACNAEDSVQRMEYVAAFAVSALASQLDRLGKPFNPLLGETYGYER